MTRVGPLMVLGLLTACGLPLFHAPPVPVRHSALVPPPASAEEIVALGVVHTGCLGRCPSYAVVFHRDGTAHREGLAFAGIPRCASGVIGETAFDDLARRLVLADFFAFDSSLDASVDVPRLVVMADLRDGRTHLVSGSAPPAPLLQVSVAFDSIAATIDWDSLPTPPKRRDCAWPTH